MLSDPDFRELTTLPFSTSVLREFSKAGYSSVGEVSGLTVEQIASGIHSPLINRRTLFSAPFAFLISL